MELNSIIHDDNCTALRSFPDESIDLVVTSPPYDNLREYGGHKWDFEGVAKELTRVLKPGGVIVWVVADATVNGSETLTSMRQAIHFKDVCGLNVHDTMIWEKTPLPQNQHPRYSPVFEYMLILCKGYPPKAFNPIETESKKSGAKTTSKGQRNSMGDNKRYSSAKAMVISPKKRRGNIWRFPTGNNLTTKDRIAFDHPAIFPDALAQDHIQSWSNPGDIVLDPFAGSGTTLKAAKELGRHYIGIEINDDYIPIIERRLAQEFLSFV
jgi:DNA modification methylase